MVGDKPPLKGTVLLQNTIYYASQVGSSRDTTMKASDRIRGRLTRTITLIGMMGSGKSLVGRQLATTLDLPFVDSDQVVEEIAGISIADIFDLAGEAKFREMEQRAIRETVETGIVVLSVGGGAVCHPDTAALLKQRSILVWLKASPKTLLSRIGSTASRPLLHGNDPLAELKNLAEARAGAYGIADVIITTDGMSGTTAANTVLRALDSHLAVT
mgnify:FL=1